MLTLLGYATPENHPPIGKLKPPGEFVRAAQDGKTGNVLLKEKTTEVPEKR
ncbi:MAG: hypothetical protein O2807_00575 [bacterium]|nr:hypothetical protein [bacterium]